MSKQTKGKSDQVKCVVHAWSRLLDERGETLAQFRVCRVCGKRQQWHDMANSWGDPTMRYEDHRRYPWINKRAEVRR